MADFEIHIDQAHIDLLLGRLARVRWPSAIEGAGWERGTDIAYLRDLVEHWKSRFDWRAVEARLNQLPQVKVEVDGLGLHAVHQRSADADAHAVLLLHGWPDCFVRYEKALPLLRDLHVVVPSLPGYAFSDRPTEAGWSTQRMADAMAELMTSLGYDRFAVSGGDIGGGVALRLAIRHKARITGLHLTDVPFSLTSQLDPGILTDAESATMTAVRQWQATEGAYAMMQSTKPMTAAYGLSDSPTGLAAWIVEKLRAWSDCDGDISRRFSLDDVLTIVCIYWFTNTIGSSFEPYFETPPVEADDARGVPTGVAIFPADISAPQRSLGERFLDVVQWTQMPSGGHFTAMEEPELFAEDLRAFLAGL